MVFAPGRAPPAIAAVLTMTDKGRAVLVRAKKLVGSRHEARLTQVLSPANRAALLEMLAKIAQQF